MKLVWSSVSSILIQSGLTVSAAETISVAKTVSVSNTFMLQGYLMAPSREIFDAVVRKLDEISGATAEQNFEGGSMLEDDDPDSHGSLLDFPYGGSSMEIAFHIILFPLKALMHYTIPDVRVLDSHGNPTATLGKAFMTAFMCLIWLIVGSYAMVASLEALAGEFSSFMINFVSLWCNDLEANSCMLSDQI